MAVELEIKSNIQEYINSLKRGQEANRNFFLEYKKGGGEQLGIIEKLERKQQTLNELRKRSNSTKEIKEYNKEIKNTEQEINKVTNATTGWGKVLTGIKSILPALGITALIGGLISIGKQMFSVRAEFQKYEAILKNTLGSETASRQAMAMLTEVASELPISLKEATDSFIRLANRGMIPTKTEIIKLTDIALSQGKSLDMFVEAMLDAQTGEFERLKEFGIKARQEGDKVTFTFKGQSQTVKKTDEDIKNYLLSLGDIKGVVGSSAAVMQTLNGKVSNLGDAWDNFLNNLGKNTQGILNTAIGWISSFVSMMANAVMSVDQLQQKVFDKKSQEGFEQAMIYINDLTNSLVKTGIKQQEAQRRAIELYKEETEASLKSLNDKLKITDDKGKEGIRKQINLMKEELSLVNSHYEKLKEIELKKLQDSKKQNKENLDAQKKLQEDLKTLIADGNKAALADSSLTAEERLKKELEFSLKQLDLREKEFKNNAAFNSLTLDQQKAFLRAFNQLREGAWGTYYDGLVENDEKEKKQREDANLAFLGLNKDFNISELEQKKKYLEADLEEVKNSADKEKKIKIDALTVQIAQADIALRNANQKKQDAIRQNQIDEAALIDDGGRAVLDLEISFYEKDISALEGSTNEEDMIFKRSLENKLNAAKIAKKKLDDLSLKDQFFSAIGIDPNSDIGKQYIAAMDEVVNKTIESFQQILDAQVQAAEQKRQIIDDEISEVEGQIQKEQEGKDAGHANDLQAEKLKLEALKRERKKALEEEKEAKRQQAALETVMQTVSMISAAANLFQATSKLGPIGLIIAIASIAAMFTAFAVAKSKAADAASKAKFAEGGWIKGASHSEGGVDIEAEGGEFMTKKSSSKKYGDLLEAINKDDTKQIAFEALRGYNKEIFLNRDAFRLNPAIVDFEGTNKRLERIENEMKQLNGYFKGQKNISYQNGSRIEQTKGHTRIIRNG